jgi:hypothetical protein
VSKGPNKERAREALKKTRDRFKLATDKMKQVELGQLKQRIPYLDISLLNTISDFYTQIVCEFHQGIIVTRINPDHHVNWKKYVPPQTRRSETGRRKSMTTSKIFCSPPLKVRSRSKKGEAIEHILADGPLVAEETVEKTVEAIEGKMDAAWAL